MVPFYQTPATLANGRQTAYHGELVITDAHRRQVLSAQEDEKPLRIRTHSFLPNARSYVDRLLKVFLDELGMPQVFDALSFCIRELAVNAKKANTKRLYFAEKGLDPSGPDYEKGMATFKQDILEDQDHYLRLLKEKDLWITIEFLKWEKTCSVAVRNNVPILATELARVNLKIALSRNFQSLEDAMGEALDESEGAGLGIVVLVLMLRRLGFPGDSFQFYTLGDETVARIILPLTID